VEDALGPGEVALHHGLVEVIRRRLLLDQLRAIGQAAQVLQRVAGVHHEDEHQHRRQDEDRDRDQQPPNDEEEHRRPRVQYPVGAGPLRMA
jgi:hypothetical protein